MFFLLVYRLAWGLAPNMLASILRRAERSGKWDCLFRSPAVSVTGGGGATLVEQMWQPACHGMALETWPADRNLFDRLPALREVAAERVKIAASGV